jgi:SpoVK/Ycf46/Vps4 family AAA+-type ATPase
MVLIAPELERFAGPLRSLRVRGMDAAERSGAAIATAFLTASSNADLSLTQDECERLGLAFPLPLAEIEDAVHLAVLDGALSQSDALHYEMLAAKCRRVASPELPKFAQRIKPSFTLDDVVLPEEWHDQLKELVGHVVHAPQVMNAWGFGAQVAYGRGVAALFTGASGTGKTMAAQAIAHELQTEAFLVDLSRIVSKFIGESEKHLDAVFTDAERAGAVLVFDEADAIFGKRSEVKDAHDRYANIEVAYLLQRMETFSGLIILTTNFRQNLDNAFLRRLRFMVEFPKPDAAAREAIWRRCLPGAAPLSADLDFAALGRRIEVTGGNIRQITLRAAFAAADEGAPAIAMRHVLGAARAELVKLGRASAVRELEEYEALSLKTSRQAA